MNKRIVGKLISLRPATLADRQSIFEWLAHSDLTRFIMGPPDYPDHPVPTWEEFIDDYREYFFDGSKPLKGRCFIIEQNNEPIGQINHDTISGSEASTELDIWFRSSKYINKGYGTDALITLCDYLAEKFGCRKIFISPSERNRAAIRAYEKAGFVKTDMISDSSVIEYYDNIIMVKIMG